MKLSPAIALLAALASSATADAAPVTRADGPKLAVVVGSNHGLVDEEPLRFAETDAQKVHRALVDLGGYRDDEIVDLQGASADELRAALVRVGAAGGKKSTVFFYYSGHGDERALHLRGARVPVDEVKAALAEIETDVQIILVDSCRSGALIRAKGATLGPAFDVDVRGLTEVKGRVIITSSSANEVAQESDRLQGSFFTHYWVSGLYGRADANDDGVVTLEEAYRFAHYKTVTETQASTGGVQHPSYDLEVAGEGSLVLSNLRRQTSALVLDASSEGRYLVFDAENRLLLTELVVGGPGRAELRLPPGRYRVTKRQDDRLLAKEITVVEGKSGTLADGDLDEVALAGGAEKGEVPLTLRARVGRAVSPSGHGPSVALGARGYFIDGLAPGVDVTVGYRLDWRYFLVEPRIAVRSASSTAGPPTLYVEGDVGSAAALRLPLGPVALLGGGDVGIAPFVRTAAPDLGLASPAGLLPLSLTGRGLVGAELEVLDGLLIGARATAGGQVFTLRGMPVVFPTAGATLGATVLF